ncbi:nucleotidyltransferase domain-containing protein [Desulfofundulus sp. TPOSR]|uniref:nucleotidyltransferase domain-containing protein n=1 Tax=Desulfofundulus sp. TPOSR TaxID=2714340 RepID=UPI00140AAB57|nr:nucleotidyltransferase domain-containing protein [Desulfofundulus sp. TPOSR]NHM27401.1 nucleotidyltransferase domain-containing protein [Desulfofundulus sp. TPOSR]
MPVPVDKRVKAIVLMYADALKNKDVPVKAVILFGSHAIGSHARGNSTPNADIDVLVITERLDKKIRDTIKDEAHRISLKENVPVTALACDMQEFQSPSFQAEPLYREITRKGIIFHRETW